MITTTIHAQDLYDQEGDAARGRKTAPLELGDAVARWSISVAVAFWSLTMPAYTGMLISDHWLAYPVPLLLGAVTIIRMFTLRGVQDDRKTSKAWAVWSICLYALPLVRGLRMYFAGSLRRITLCCG